MLKEWQLKSNQKPTNLKGYREFGVSAKHMEAAGRTKISFRKPRVKE